MSLARESAVTAEPAPLTQHETAERFKALLQDTDDFLREIRVPKESNLTFEVDGIPFNARYIPDGRHSRIVLWAALGYLPYSVVDPVKRKQLIRILEGARFLPTARMGIDIHMQILVKGTYPVGEPPAPDYFLIPLIKLLQETRPFIKLIGEFL